MVTNTEEILSFWFGKPESLLYGKPRQVWFTKDRAFDREIRSRFLTTYQQAVLNHLNQRQESARGCLALILLFDQFPRQMFRGLPEAFATDERALKLAQFAVAQAFDRQLLPVQRWFIYLPFEHSENLAHQQQAVALFSTLAGDAESASGIEYAKRHMQVIERFGRFPHRNQVLGRKNTPEEEEFLKQPGSSF